MKKFIAFILCLFSLATYAQDKVFLFSYFTDNGQDGLHLAYSNDGLIWTALNEGKSYLTPSVGNDKLMRDPFIIQGKDGLFHLVWTSGWWDKQIGYASSPDLIHWSEQKGIPVMEYESTARNSWLPKWFTIRQPASILFSGLLRFLVAIRKSPLLKTKRD